jgi:glycosyltransferase involved in cell wall biosynthesis
MRLGIDASNIRGGGGVTHLVELLRAADPQAYGFKQVIVWGGAATFGRFEERPWLRKVHEPLLDRSLPYRLYWQRFMLVRALRREGCDMLFAPGGSYIGPFRPFVSMSQNLLPFEWTEARRYGFSWQLLRNMFLRFSQSWSFRAANGVIFLTEYARDVVMKTVKDLDGMTTIIPHGINDRFFLPPRHQKALSDASREYPFRILYVSIIDVYKHQWHVAEAVAQLINEGLPVQLDLIGPAYPPALKRINKALHKFDKQGSCIRYHGLVPYEELLNWYHQADILVFASSCENMPNILLEAMVAGLPIACSNRGPMPEVLGAAGLYFNPENPAEIACAIRSLLDSPALRAEKAEAAYWRAKAFTWQRCAEQTFQFLAQQAADSSQCKINLVVD